MNHQYLWKPVYCHLFIEVVNFLAFCAFVATFLHPLWENEAFEAVIQTDITRYPNSFPGNGYTQVHKVVEGKRRMTAMLALNLIH